MNTHITPIWLPLCWLGTVDALFRSPAPQPVNGWKSVSSKACSSLFTHNSVVTVGARYVCDVDSASAEWTPNMRRVAGAVYLRVHCLICLSNVVCAWLWEYVRLRTRPSACLTIPCTENVGRLIIQNFCGIRPCSINFCVVCCVAGLHKYIYVYMWCVCLATYVCLHACVSIYLPVSGGMEISTSSHCSMVYRGSMVHRGSIVGSSWVHHWSMVHCRSMDPSWAHRGSIVGPSWVHGSSWVHRPSWVHGPSSVYRGSTVRHGSVVHRGSTVHRRSLVHCGSIVGYPSLFQYHLASVCRNVGDIRQPGVRWGRRRAICRSFNATLRKNILATFPLSKHPFLRVHVTPSSEYISM